jgi:hypothetical protein
MSAFSVSFFTTEEIRMECKDDERFAPGVQTAKAAEEDAVRRGDLNFPGIGLSAADFAFLAGRRVGPPALRRGRRRKPMCNRTPLRGGAGGPHVRAKKRPRGEGR